MIRRNGKASKMLRPSCDERNLFHLNKIRQYRKLRHNILCIHCLSWSDPTDHAQYQQGLMLAACDSPEAVPILCRTIGKRQIIDKKMFAEIERLAGPEHGEIIEKLPSLVRPGQAGRAKKVVEHYLARMNEAGGK